MADDRTVGQVIDDRYELRALLGQGGMGVVWRAYDMLLIREVAVKEIRFPAIVGAAGREALCDRLREDARRVAVVDHPAVVRVLDVVDEGGRPFVVTELVEAPTLAERVAAGGPMAPEQVAAIGVDLLDALAAAHAQGLMHRFVQPAKVLLPPEGGARLCDFGLAALIGDPLVTASGAIGTVSYMAPEQNGRPLGDAATDVWSVGATLFYAVEGRPPFDAGAAKATLAAIADARPRPLLRAGGLRRVLADVLVKDPAARPDVAFFRRQLAGLGVPGAEFAVPAQEPDFFTPDETVESPTGARPWYERETLADPAERSFFGDDPAPPPPVVEPIVVEPVVVEPVVVEPVVVEPVVVEPVVVEPIVVEPVVAPPGDEDDGGVWSVVVEPVVAPPGDEDEPVVVEPVVVEPVVAPPGDEDEPVVVEPVVAPPGDEDDGVWSVGVAFGPDDDDPDPDDRDPDDRDPGPGPDDFWDPQPQPWRPPEPAPADEPAEPEGPPLPPAVALSRMFSPDVERPPAPYEDAVPPDDPPPRALWPLPRPWRPGAAFLAGLIVVVLVFLVLTGTRFLTGRNDQVARSQAATVNWITYTDPATGFSLDHPANWMVIPNEAVVDFRDPDSSAALRVAVQAPLGTPQQVWAELEQRFVIEHPSYKRVRLEPRTLNGREAAAWEFTWTDGSGTPLHNSDLAVNAGGKAFALNFQTRAAEWTLLNSLFDRFTSTFVPPA